MPLEFRSDSPCELSKRRPWGLSHPMAAWVPSIALYPMVASKTPSWRTTPAISRLEFVRRPSGLEEETTAAVMSSGHGIRHTSGSKG
jgi:hypothetical protein